MSIVSRESYHLRTFETQPSGHNPVALDRIEAVNSQWVIDPRTLEGQDDLQALCLVGAVVDITNNEGRVASYVLCGASKTVLIVEGWSDGAPDGRVETLDLSEVIQVLVP
jgi:hypothetical protein